MQLGQLRISRAELGRELIQFSLRLRFLAAQVLQQRERAGHARGRAAEHAVPREPRDQLRIAVLHHLVERALHDASRLRLLQLRGCLLQPVQRGSEDLLVSLGVGLAKRKHSGVALQVDHFGLQILALLAQVGELVSQPYACLAGCVVTGLKVVIDQVLVPVDSPPRPPSADRC